jgi:hypothetical protein
MPHQQMLAQSARQAAGGGGGGLQQQQQRAPPPCEDVVDPWRVPKFFVAGGEVERAPHAAAPHAAAVGP